MFILYLQYKPNKSKNKLLMQNVYSYFCTSIKFGGIINSLTRAKGNCFRITVIFKGKVYEDCICK
ncbi:MAG: hypothetical protein B6I20_13215 [Bacteroidetes bacterium 4572_117]|nr:MAG: hypothetical protein B6I20_13215 [Bacteroidetes bacterium 4572_117]